MGVVYEAHDTHLDRPVSIKVLPPECVADPERRRRFVQEAKAAAALRHPNILHITTLMLSTVCTSWRWSSSMATPSLS
jgi:serine/threonine protein kinase